MSAQGGIVFQEKVSRLLSRHKGKPILKATRPLVLKNAVANRKLNKGEATCITEMSVMMACWKQNNFVDTMCSNEMKEFYTCVEKAQAAMRKKSEQSSLHVGRMDPKQATTLLKRYPNMCTEI